MAAGGAGLWWTLSSRFSPIAGTDFTQADELRSSNGGLHVRLEAAPGPVQFGGREASALGYNGGVPGPTLRLSAGDTLNVELVNSMAVPTNLHVHGLHVSPQGNGDNVFVTVDPATSFNYEYKLPADHPPGVYWYHPHHHGMVADQIFAGLFGAIIVEDAQPVDVSRERVMVVSDITLDGAGTVVEASPMDRMLGREGDVVLVNGRSNPELSARPGERERWRIVNTCVARYLRLRLDGQQMQLLGLDSGRFHTPESVEELLLAPGNRADVLITAAAGDSTLRALYYDRGSMTGMMGPAGPAPNGGQRQGEIALAALSVSGEPAGPPPAVPAQQAPADLRTAVVAAHRQLTFAAGGMGMGMGMGMMSFTINGREFNESRRDTTVAAQTVEEWTLTNSSPMDHPFHLHVWPMQIVEDRGKTPDAAVWRDVVNVPANGQVKVRVAFKDFTGRSVYHCHILDHEDSGMMGVIEVR
jgi:FtsP/CotA-like multicopper oxidase with cupredoxin domain